MYILILKIEKQINDDENFNANATVEMMASYGYLSAADWPLLYVSIFCGDIPRYV